MNRGGMENDSENINVKAEVQKLFQHLGIIRPGDTGQIIVHMNCGGITRIDKNVKVA